jgi:hypothetical protein
MSAAAILKLQASGFSSDQVSALAELLDTQVATKADIEAAEHRLELKILDVRADLGGVKADLEVKIGGVKADLETKIGSVKTDLEAKIGGFKADLEAKIGGVKADLESKIGGVKTDLELKIADIKSEINLLKWMIGFILAFQAGIFAKLFFH